VLSRRRFGAALGSATGVFLSGCSGDGDSDATTDDRSDPEADRIRVSVADEPTAWETLRVRVYHWGEPATSASVYLDETEVPQDIGAHGRTGQWDIEVPPRESIHLSVYLPNELVWERAYDVQIDCDNYPVTDDWFSLFHNTSSIDEVQFNPHRPGTSPAIDAVFAPYAGFDSQARQFLPHLLTDWHHDGGRMVATVREDVTWETGDAVDAADVAFQWEILLASDHVAADLLTGVAVVEEYEVAFEYPEETDPRVVEHAVLHERADHPPADWEPVHSGDVAPAALDVPEPTASGPLTVTGTGDPQADDPLTARFYEPRSRVDGAAVSPATRGAVNWSGYEVLDALDNPRAAMISLIVGEIDGSDPSQYWWSQRNQFTDSDDYRSFESPGVGGLALWFDHTSDPWTDRAVRRAIATALAPRVATESAEAPDLLVSPSQTGLPEPTRSAWFEADVPDGFDSANRDPARARDLLAAAGHEADDLSATIAAPDRHRYTRSTVVQSMADQLEDFGVDVDLRLLSRSEYPPTTAEGFDLLALPRGTHRRQFHPNFAYRYQLAGDPGTPPALSGYADWTDSPEIRLDGEDVSIHRRLDDLARAGDDSRTATAVRDLAKVVNRDVPFVEVYQRPDRTYVHDRWDSPSEGPDTRTEHPLFWLPIQNENRYGEVDCGGGLLKPAGSESPG